MLIFFPPGNLSYIWTSGRLCDFDGCDREDLKPKNIKGWFFSNTNTKMAPTNNSPPGWKYQPWSQTGHTKVPQPDNAEFDINQTSESCMGVLNNIYNDGIKWHDIACYHKKPVVCEDSEDLLNFIAQEKRKRLATARNNNNNNNQFFGNNQNNNRNNGNFGNQAKNHFRSQGHNF